MRTLNILTAVHDSQVDLRDHGVVVGSIEHYAGASHGLRVFAYSGTDAAPRAYLRANSGHERTVRRALPGGFTGCGCEQQPGSKHRAWRLTRQAMSPAFAACKN